MQSEGTDTIAVGERDGQVILNFPKPVQWVALDPDTARQVGEAIAKQAYHTHYGLKPAENASIISEQTRSTLITRITHVIRSMQDKGQQPGFIAANVVDTILAEIS